MDWHLILRSRVIELAARTRVRAGVHAVDTPPLAVMPGASPLLHGRPGTRWAHGPKAWLLALSLLLTGPTVTAADDDLAPFTRNLLGLLFESDVPTRDRLATLDREWDDRAAPMVIDAINLSRRPDVTTALVALLQARTGQKHQFNLDGWYAWLWSQPPREHPDYEALRARLYGAIDPKFAGYFAADRPRTIRLDEVLWGGVVQDGIPPLRAPKMIPATEADYLAESNVVFGLEVNGDARAYPKRILAWHELFTDTVGGVPVAGVYCTLCGSMILYESTHDGTLHDLGTSGFLYRSNKLMYDAATQSLWSTLEGKPVIGPLVGRDIVLERGWVVTTTWGEWKARHPDSLVLSPDTGHVRDYREGVAYMEYFGTDALMFPVAERDGRLANKAEVLGLLFQDHGGRPLAISADYLADNPLHHDAIGGFDLVIVTDPSGANRVYRVDGTRFATYDGGNGLTDADGVAWTLHEDRLEAADGRVRHRLPAHRAFWFGWYGAFPNTRLVH
jgi:hypothetical protein